MATVIWNKRPELIWRELLLSGHQDFGTTTAKRFVKKTDEIVARLEKHPESGFPESLLKSRKCLYRAVHLLPHHKIIYRYYNTSDTVRIVDIWDTRMNPDKLRKRI